MLKLESLDIGVLSGDDGSMSIALLMHLVGAGVWVSLIVAGIAYQTKGSPTLTRIFRAFALSVVWQVGTGVWLYAISTQYAVWRLCAQLGLYIVASVIYAVFLLRKIRWNRSQSVAVLVDSNNS